MKVPGAGAAMGALPLIWVLDSGTAVVVCSHILTVRSKEEDAMTEPNSG